MKQWLRVAVAVVGLHRRRPAEAAGPAHAQPRIRGRGPRAMGKLASANATMLTVMSLRAS